MSGDPSEREVESTYDTFWRDIVERPDGTLDVEQEVERRVADAFADEAEAAADV